MTYDMIMTSMIIHCVLSSDVIMKCMIIKGVTMRCMKTYDFLIFLAAVFCGLAAEIPVLAAEIDGQPFFGASYNAWFNF